jgi:hypothetical protein
MSILNYGGIVQNSMAGLANTLGQFGQFKQQQAQQQAQMEAQQAQQQAAEADMQAMKGLSDLYANNASAKELYEYGLSNPAAYRMVQDAIGFKNDQTKQIMSDTLISAIQNPEQKDAIITKGVQDIAAAGGNPQYLAQSIGEDFGDFERGAIPFLSSLGGQGAEFTKSYMSMKPQAPKEMSEFEKAKVEGKKVDQELRRLEIEQKKLESQQKRETSDLKKQELQQKIDDKEAEKEQIAKSKEQESQNAIQFSTEVFNLANEIANDPQLNDITGNVNNMFPTLSGKSQDLINKAERLESMLTKENLGLMSGVLTDKDIAMLRSISSGLNVSESGIKGSYEGTRKRLQEIANKIRKGMGDTPAMDSSRNNVPLSELSDEDLLNG